MKEYQNLNKPKKILFKCLIKQILEELQHIDDIEALHIWYNKKGEDFYKKIAQNIASHSDNEWIWKCKLPLKCACTIRKKEIKDKIRKKEDKVQRIEL
jgi:hypothetical protein